MSNTNSDAVKPPIDTTNIAPAQTASLVGAAPKINHATTSELPPLDIGGDIPTNGENLKSHRKNQLKRLLTETWLRVALIIGFGLAVFFTIFLFKSASTDPIVEDAGERSNSLTISNTPDGSDNLNPAQAQYLMELQRQEAAAQAGSGVTNAPSLVLPKASINGVDSNAVSDASAFTVGRTTSYYDRVEGEQPVAAMSLTSTGRFSTVGASQLDENANQLALERARVAANSVPAQAGVDPASNRSTATYNTNQNSGNNGGDYNGANNGGNNAGNNGDGSAAGAPVEQAQERQPDPDLPIVQQRLYDSYNQQMQEMQAQEQRLAEMQAAQQQQAAQLRQQRQQLASQAIAAQTQANAKNKSMSGFSSKKYSVPPKAPEGEGNNNQNNQGGNNQGGNNQTSSYWERAPDPGYQPSSYSSNSMYGNQGQYSNKQDTPRPPALLPKHIIRAGTRWPVVITKQVNTDEGLSVTGVIVGGQFDGAVVHGVVQPSGRNIGVLFNRIEPKNPRKPIIPLNALAQTIGGQKEAVASKVNNHHFQNYSVMALESAIGGYGEAYSDSNETVVTGPNGVIIQSKGETTQKEVTAEILKEFSSKLNTDIGRLGNRPPTFIINQGSVLQMVLLSNLDIYGTAGDGADTPMPLQQQSSNSGRSSL